MTRTVVSSAQVGHLWAHRAQDHARNSSHSVSFDGDTFYSYRTPIARLVRDGVGNDVALISSHRYSQTTDGKHKHCAWGAARHLPAFTVPALGLGCIGRHSERSRNLEDAHAVNLLYLQEQYGQQVARFLRALSRPHGYEYLTGLAASVRDYAQRFGLPVPSIDTAADIAKIGARFDRLDAMRADPAYAAKREAEREKREARAAAKREREDRERRERYATQLADWRNGGRLTFYCRDGFAALRVSADGQRVETSQGAEVPADDARRAVRFIAERKRTGRAWQRNGEQFHVGAFQLDSVTANGEVRAGCHHIAWAEIVSVAALLGCPCDDSGIMVQS